MEVELNLISNQTPYNNNFLFLKHHSTDSNFIMETIKGDIKNQLLIISQSTFTHSLCT